MYKDETVMTLGEDLSMTRLAFAQVICNFERKDKYVSWIVIANNWLYCAAQMQEQEWVAGREALLHYLRLQSSKSAQAAIVLLTSPQSEYVQNEKKYRGLYRHKGSKSTELYNRAVAKLMEGLVVVSFVSQNTDLHCATRGAYAILVEYIRAWKARIVGVKNDTKK